MFKKIMASILVCVAAFSLTACQDTSWAFKYNEKTVNAGLYIAFQMQEYSLAQYHDDVDFTIPLLKQEIEGMKAADFINVEALKDVNEYFAIDKIFNDMGLELTKEDLNEIETFSENYENVKAIYQQNGVGLNSYIEMLTSQQKSKKIFDAMYGEGGTEEVKIEDLKLHFKENFAAVNLYEMKLNTGDDLTDAQKEQNELVKEYAPQFAEKINNGGLSFNEAVDWYKHLASEDEHDHEEEGEIKKDEETISYVKIDSKSPSEKVVKAIFEEVQPDKKAVVIPDEKGYYIAVRYDVLENEEKFNELRDSILYDVKGETFEKFIETTANEIASNVVENKAAINRYTPKKIKF